MRITIIKKRLRLARQSWAKSEVSPDIVTPGNFVTGVLRGLHEALLIVEQTQGEDIQRTKAARRSLSRWTGLLLYNACRRAYARLKEGDRRSAMKVLGDVLSRVRI